jgi:predicted RNA-binding protein
MGTVDKVVALLSLAAGAYDAQKFGQPNLYLKQLDKAIEDDIKDQNLDIQEQAFRKAQLLHDAKILSARLARSTKDRDKKEGFLKNENTLDKAFKKQLRGQNQKVRKIKFIETISKRGITAKEVAYADAIHPELKVGQKVIKGRDGLYYYTRGDLKKLKEYISDAQDSIDGLTQLEEYVDKVTIFEQIPGASIISKDAAGAQSLRDRLVGKLRIEFFGPGVMTDQEREQAKKILGNPNAFWSRDSVEKEKIRNLLLKINYGIRQKLRRDGLPIPESRNDRMVKAWLKRAGRPITDSNKARAVNALIAAEKKNVRLGGKPGKHWVMDEPLPI